MALIKCSECGKEISDKAEVCMNCGYPLQKVIREEKNKYKKPFNELSKKEKQLVSKQAVKDTTFIMINVAILILVIFVVILLPTLISLFINIPLLIIQVIVNKLLIKKYYNENLFFTDKEYNIKEQELSSKKYKIVIDNKERKDKTNYDILIIIVLIAITIYTIINITSRFNYFHWNTNATDKYGFLIPKYLNICDLMYNIAKILNYLIPCLELWLLFFYLKYKNKIFKKILKIIGISGCICLITFIAYLKMFQSIYMAMLHSIDFIIYTLITTIFCFILLSIKTC